MAGKSTDWRPGPTVCRCCLSEGCYKDISTEYFWMGKREVYAEMLSDTLNLSISYSKAGGPNSNSRLICEPCISRLRDASDFKRQVQECEKTFMHHLDGGSSSISLDIDNTTGPSSNVKIEQVKLERLISDDDDDFDDHLPFPDEDDDDDMDDQPLTKLATKVPKKETVDIMDLLDNAKVAEKRKAPAKVKGLPTKKTKIIKKEVRPVKPSASKTTKVEKKKKDGTQPLTYVARHNAKIIVKNATVYPFRLPESALMCVFCCESFHEPLFYRRHMKEEHKIFKLEYAFLHCSEGYLKVDCSEIECRICFQTFEKLDDVAKHLKDTHNFDLNLEGHLGLHPFKFDQEKLICGVCDTNMPCLRRLSRHVSNHFLNYTCDTCGKSYATNSSLQKHMKCVHISPGIYCPKCKKRFDTSDAVKAHQEDSARCRRYLCNICSDRFMSWVAKQEHLVEVHGLEKKTYPCAECKMHFPSRHIYISHFNTTHASNGFVCPHCGRKFASNKSLEDHIVVHTGEKMFQCEDCAKSFSRKKNLIQHSWTHSEIKRFECVPCNRKFNQRVSYKSHMRVHHPDVTIV